MVAIQHRSPVSRHVADRRQRSAVGQPAGGAGSVPVLRPAVRSAARPHLQPAGAARPVGRPLTGRVSPSTYRRRQALAAGAVAALSAVVSVVLGALGGGSLTAPERPLPVVAGEVYEVQAGDTFWAIARSLDPIGDPRPLVDRLVADHGSPVLVVGEQIRLPDRS